MKYDYNEFSLAIQLVAAYMMGGHDLHPDTFDEYIPNPDKDSFTSLMLTPLFGY